MFVGESEARKKMIDPLTFLQRLRKNNRRRENQKLGYSPQKGHFNLITNKGGLSEPHFCRVSAAVSPQQKSNVVKEYLTEGTKLNPFKKFGY